jgi:ADP-ribose pyrophosphatase
MGDHDNRAEQPAVPVQPTSHDKVLWEGRHLKMILRNGWECVERPGVTGIVGIVAVTDDNKLVLVEQYRPPVGGPVVELPAGLVGDVAGQAEEGLEDAARRELEEETGYRAEKLERLCEGVPSAGMSDEVITLFLATGLRKTGPGGGDESEDIVVHEVPLVDVMDWLSLQEQRGVRIDLKVYTGLWFCRGISRPVLPD